MTAAVVKAIFRHRRWETDRVVHFLPSDGAELLSTAVTALGLSIGDSTPTSIYDLRALYYLGTEGG